MSPYYNPVQVIFAQSATDVLGPLVKGRRAWVITTPGMDRRGTVAQVQKAVGGSHIGVWAKIFPNPTFDLVARCAREVLCEEPELLIALGGGAALDCAKAVAALRGIANPREWLDTTVRKGGPYPEDFNPLAIIAIPTTAGTGSEVTMWGSIWDMKEKQKYSISHPRLYPETAVLIPDLTYTLSYEQSLCPALDALSHCMESIWNRNANPTSDKLATETIPVLTDFLGDGYTQQYTQPDVRSGLQRASLKAGLAFSNTRTAIAHSISYPLTAHLGIPHGLACSFTLPEVLCINYNEDQQQVTKIVQSMGCNTVSEAIDKLYGIYRKVGVATQIKRFIKRRSDATRLEAPFITPGRADNNLAPVSQEDAIQILEVALARLGIDD